MVDGRWVLLFVDSTTFTPAALYVDAETATLNAAEREVRLDTGAVVRQGVLYDPAGACVDPDRPKQLFTRWYGFGLSFPGPEVFG